MEGFYEKEGGARKLARLFETRSPFFSGEGKGLMQMTSPFWGLERTDYLIGADQRIAD